MKKIIFFLISGWFFLSPILTHASLIEEKKCSECHRLSKTEDARRGPDLFYAGDKFQSAWLLQYLQNPVTLRKVGTIFNPGFLKGESEDSHPVLSKKDAMQISQELLAMTLSETPDETSSLKALTKGKIAKTKYEFERTFSCISCHQSLNLAGKPRGGISGPSLINAGNRLQPNWIANWLKNPKLFSEKSRMPIYKMDDETRLRFTQFIMTLKKENLR
ncbi:MAG: hypothetical protein H8E32_05930 [Nitrospinae bacterium]|nr:hypothetical protein [Nitrospinota bacterium]